MELSTYCSCVAAASAMLIAAIATGALLEELASRSLLGLHKVPLGPNGGADVLVELPAPYALASDLSAAPSRVLETLAGELASHTAQGMGGAGQMLLQLLAACVAIHAVVDVPTKLGGFFEVERRLERRSELKEA